MSGIDGIKIGDYVIAHRWDDLDPCDPCALGFVAEIQFGRVRVAQEDGSDIPGVGKRFFPYAIRVPATLGEVWINHARAVSEATFGSNKEPTQ